MADLGDISSFLREGAVSNLDWLEVDEAEYRANDTLPKQNLNVAPDLEAMWAHKGESPTNYLIPNVTPVESVRGMGNPHTMGDMSQAHGHLRASPEHIRKTARFALMQSSDLQRLKNALTSRYDMDSLHAAKNVIADVIAERGLLGKLYINASDFPTCHTGSAKPSDFVKRYARDARFIVAKPECSGCAHAHEHQSGETCSVFHKEIQVEVPMTDSLAAEVERMQQAKGKQLTVTASVPKERIRLAMLADDFRAPGPSPMPQPKDNVARLMRQGGTTEADFVKPLDLTPFKETAKAAVGSALQSGKINVQAAQQAYRIIGMATEPAPIEMIRAKALGIEPEPQRMYAGVGQQAPMAAVSQEKADQQLIAASGLTKKRDEETQRMLSAKKAEPVIAIIRREMLKGRYPMDVANAMKLSFSPDDLAATKEHWEPVIRKMGAYGVVYTTQDSFSDCHVGADFLAKYNPGVKVVVAGEKCGGCIYNKIGRCLMYGKPLVKEANEILTEDTVKALVAEHKVAGRLPAWDDRQSADFGKTPVEALQFLHFTTEPKNLPVVHHSQSMAKGFYGSTTEHRTSSITRGEILKMARRFLNEGLYGEDLKFALKGRFESRDIVAAAGDLRSVLGEQGLQGVYYVDPTVYDDYGKGCKEASRLHRSGGVEYVKIGSKCGSCVHQTRTGFCSVINKALVQDPPYFDKSLQQREVLASGRSTEINFNNLVNNGMSMMAEYEIQHGTGAIEVDEPRVANEIGIEFGTGGQGLKL
jgi:hypothetical protein